MNYATIALCVIGILAAGYLSYTHLFRQPIICTTGEGCDRVNTSEYASFLNVPVAYIGLTGYIVMLIGSLWRWMANGVQTGAAQASRVRLDWFLFLASLLGFVFSMYLTAMELFVIYAICTWCVINAITITLLFMLYAVRIWNGTGDDALRESGT